MSRRPLLSLALSLLLVAAASLAVAAKGDDERPRAPTAGERGADDKRGPDKTDAPRKDDGARTGKGEADDADEDERDGERKKPAPADKVRLMVGRGFTQTTAQGFGGDYVNFSYTQTGIQNFTAGGVAYFSATAQDGDLDAKGGKGGAKTGVQGSSARVRIETPTYRFDAHDNPSAVATLRAEGPIQLTFPAGSLVQAFENHARITLPTGEAALVSAPHDLSVDGLTLTAGKRVHFMLDRAKGGFDAHREDIGKAVGKRKIGAEISLERQEGEVREDVVQYENVTVTSVQTPGNLTLILDGHGNDGRVIVVNVGPDVLDADTVRSKLRILFDNVTMREASNLTDVLDPDDDGLHPEYYLVQDQDGFQVIVSVPHYSVHTLSLVGLLEEVTPSVVVGVTVGLVAVAAGGAFLFRRRPA